MEIIFPQVLEERLLIGQIHLTAVRSGVFHPATVETPLLAFLVFVCKGFSCLMIVIFCLFVCFVCFCDKMKFSKGRNL